MHGGHGPFSQFPYVTVQGTGLQTVVAKDWTLQAFVVIYLWMFIGTNIFIQFCSLIYRM